MPEYFPLPQATSAAVMASPSERHPGLLMDVLTPHVDEKFESFDQQDGQKPHLDRIVKAAKAFGAMHGQALLGRWADIEAAAHLTWDLTTVWRLAAHLSRPTALENAALCMHPVYGFPYLPGNGLKGLCLTYAKSHAERPAYERVLGTTAGAGSVAILEAWPARWPVIEVDITNNHHPEYYRQKGDSPPGDWENPIPVYFLTVKAGTAFRFALRKAHSAVDSADLEMAKQWLIGGLTELGFGAKTAAGYGYFQPENAAATAGPVSGGAPRTAREEFTEWATAFARRNNFSQAQTDIANRIRAFDEAEKAWAADELLRRLEGHPVLQEKGKKSLRRYLDGLKSPS